MTKKMTQGPMMHNPSVLFLSIFTVGAVGACLWWTFEHSARVPDGAKAAAAPAAQESQPQRRDKRAASDARAQAPEPSAQDPAFAQRRAEIAAVGDAQARRGLWIDWLTHLSETQPELAVRYAVLLTEAEGQAEALRETLGRWLEVAPAQASDWLLAHAQALPAETVRSLAGVLAGFDVAPAISLAQTLPPGMRSSALRDVFSEWTAQSPWAAGHAACDLSEPRDRVAVVPEIARLWVHSDPAAALAWADDIAEPRLRTFALDPLVREWAGQDPVRAAQAILDLPAQPDRVRWVDQVVSTWADSDPDGAGQWVQWAQSQGLSGTTLDNVMSAWVARDAAAAAEWARSQPTDTNRGQPAELLSLALSRWRAQDARAAASWEHVHPGSPSSQGAP